MKKITIKKKWVERLEKFEGWDKAKAVYCLYEYLANEQVVVQSIMDLRVAEFIDFVEADIKADAAKRERARQRREERRRQQAEKNQNQPENTIQNSVNLTDYQANPALYMFDGFMNYMMSREGKRFRPSLPAGESLKSVLHRFRQWVIAKSRSVDISKLNVFRDLLNRNMREIMAQPI